MRGFGDVERSRLNISGCYSMKAQATLFFPLSKLLALMVGAEKLLESRGQIKKPNITAFYVTILKLML